MWAHRGNGDSVVSTRTNCYCAPCSRCTQDFSPRRFTSCREAVKEYQAHGNRLDKELKWFASAGSLKHIIERAVLAECPHGNKHPHQRRIPKGVLKRAKKRLLKAKRRLQHCDSFKTLHQRITDLIHEKPRIRGIGQLTLYDLALRIGKHKGWKPDEIYLHAGTREGAKRLLGKIRKDTLTRQDLCKELRQLPPYKVEDLLCVYKNCFDSSVCRACRL